MTENWAGCETQRAKTFHEWLSVTDVHGMLLFLIDQRMGAEEGTKEFMELRALADACVAYERVMFPIGHEDAADEIERLRVSQPLITREEAWSMWLSYLRGGPGTVLSVLDAIYGKEEEQP